METHFTGDETFSLEELLQEVDRYGDTPIQTGGVGRGRPAPKKKRAKGKRVVGVCDDPLQSNRIINLWAKIAAAYKTHCPHEKSHSGEECRKQCGSRMVFFFFLIM